MRFNFIKLSTIFLTLNIVLSIFSVAINAGPILNENQNFDIASATCSTHPVGDANCDNSFSLADFNIFLDEYRKFSKGEVFVFAADFNSNSKIDLRDFNIWLSSYLNPPIIPTVQPTNISGNTFNLRVLTIQYNPEQNGRNIADTYYSSEMQRYGGSTSADVASRNTFDKVVSSFKNLSNNSINYEIVKELKIKEFFTNTGGFTYTIDSYKKCVWGLPEFDNEFCENEKKNFRDKEWFEQNKICQIANDNNIDEIWIISNAFIGPNAENFMIGPTAGFPVNGSSYQINSCKKHYHVLNANYSRMDTVLHNYGHRIEANLRYLSGVWNSTEYSKHIESFANLNRYNSTASFNGKGCGNAHLPLNGTKQYEYDNSAKKNFNCTDWKNFPNYKNQTESFGCSKWNCTDYDWQVFWFGSIPRGEGEADVTLKSGAKAKFKKNWWYYLLYPDNSLEYVRPKI